jgi:hypothetical protein
VWDRIEADEWREGREVVTKEVRIGERKEGTSRGGEEEEDSLSCSLIS